jgi:hypothetical protein
MTDAHDDMGDAKHPLRVIAVIPVLGRQELLKQTIQRLLRKNGVYKVICIGWEEREVCEQAGAEFIQHKNLPLGQKWNAGFQAAEKYSPDACLFVGSSDFVSDNWIHTLSPYLNTHDLVGLPNCYFADVNYSSERNEYRVVHWHGYLGPRSGESIGIGRMISRRALDKINWMPFNNHLNSSLDGSMFGKVESRHLLKTDKCMSLSISTNLWNNLHKFDDHWSGRLKSDKVEDPDRFLQDNFPEVLNIFS